jgi:PAS domain S-box-containing protein
MKAAVTKVAYGGDMNMHGSAASKRARSVLDANAWLAAIIADSDDAIVSKALDGTITSWNRGAERLFGYVSGEVVGQPITIIIPSERWSEEDVILGKVRAGERVDHFETVRRTKAGDLIDVAVTVSPVRGPDGTIMGASKILRDITERNRASERQSLLLGEMNHRIKNLFALVSGLVAMSARTSETVGELADKLDDRINSLARAHALTLPGKEVEADDSSTTLTNLLRAILEPYADQSRVNFVGDDLALSGRALTSIALLIHELTTNAAKYGALSENAGSLTVDVYNDADMVKLIWTETGGPPPEPEPRKEGFGTMLERASLRSFSGSIERAWKAEGLVISLSFAADRLGASRDMPS